MVAAGSKAVVASGTGGATKLANVEVAGKTGSPTRRLKAARRTPGLPATRLRSDEDPSSLFVRLLRQRKHRLGRRPATREKQI